MAFTQKKKPSSFADTLKDRPVEMKDFTNDPNARWRKDKASDRQIDFLKKLLQRKRHNRPQIDFAHLTKGMASDHITRLKQRA